MAQGKNKRLTRGGKKGGKKRIIDPLSRKEWYNLKAPVPFDNKAFGFTPVTKSSGTRNATDYVKGRVIEQSYADLSSASDKKAWRKVKLIVDDVESMNAKTSFYGLDITRDKLFSMVRKWQSTLEAFVDCKTADGYILRIFVLAFTAKAKGQKKKTNYAKNSQVKEIRSKISTILTSELAKMSINDVVRNLLGEAFVDKITKAAQYIYPLKDVTIRKVKTLRRPKIDVVKLNEMYTHPKNQGRAHAAVKEEAGTENQLTKEIVHKKSE